MLNIYWGPGIIEHNGGNHPFKQVLCTTFQPQLTRLQTISYLNPP